MIVAHIVQSADCRSKLFAHGIQLRVVDFSAAERTLRGAQRKDCAFVFLSSFRAEGVLQLVVAIVLSLPYCLLEDVVSTLLVVTPAEARYE
jgi:hypothetical protein